MPRHRTPNQSKFRVSRSGYQPGHGARHRHSATAGNNAPPAIKLRNVVFTPWLAVSFGFVVASSLALTTPRAVLTFPSAPGARCQVTKCPASHGNAGHPAAASSRPVPGAPGSGTGHQGAPGQVVVPASAVPPPPPPAANPIRARLKYGLLPSRNDQYVAMIVITGQRAIGTWSLRIIVPGVRVDDVLGAHWYHSGIDGVLAVGYPAPWQKTPANMVRIILLGTETARSDRRPSVCVFDGAKCAFRALRQDGVIPGQRSQNGAAG
jgi:hypothetical protein